MKPNSSEFKALKNEWYQKLKDEGFKDAENDFGLKVYHAAAFSRETNAIKNETKETYFTLAQHFLQSHKFESSLHELIWAYRCEGLSFRNIAKKVNASGLHKPVNKDSVQKLCKRFFNEMLKYD